MSEGNAERHTIPKHIAETNEHPRQAIQWAWDQQTIDAIKRINDVPARWLGLTSSSSHAT